MLNFKKIKFHILLASLYKMGYTKAKIKITLIMLTNFGVTRKLSETMFK